MVKVCRVSKCKRSSALVKRFAYNRRIKATLKKRQARHTDPKLRAISLVCPELAVAIFAKQKRVENRTWKLPASVQDSQDSKKGTWLALHVGCGRTPRFIKKYVDKAWEAKKAPWPWNKMNPSDKNSVPLPTSSIVGLIRISGDRKLRRGEKSEDPWALGPRCWEIDRAVPLDPPIKNVKGKLLLWRVNQERSIPARERTRLYRALYNAQNRRGLGCCRSGA